ncbi:MAG: creatininase family protein [Cyanobacteria bacterium HKST-UBA05]|nr:creatininase family protein [Cyanobacteria bacterium HKST-UBA05]
MDWIGWLLHPIFSVLVPSKRIFGLYLLSALLIAAVSYLMTCWQARQAGNASDASDAEETPKTTSLWAYLFPKAVFTHPSAVQDYKYAYMHLLLHSIAVAPVVAAVIPVTTLAVVKVLQSLPFDLTAPDSLLAYKIPVMISCTLLAALISDFAIFFAHWLQHKVPLLWEFHKVHHTAKVLTPVTLYRMHPVDNLLTLTLVGLGLGMLYGVLQVVLHAEGLVANLYGVNLFFILFYLLGYNLRHSHIWISYGPRLEQLFISPAQHQIHHSAEERHWDKNMGLILAIWDKAFGTLYVPKGQESFRLGIDSDDQPRFEQSATSLFWLPFVRIKEDWQRLFTPMLKPVAVSALGIVLFVLVVLGGSNMQATQQPPAVDETVYMENLTWTEVDALIKSGTKTVIVPTGGTEQNGPHMVLGKHNRIIHYTAGRVAQTLGHTLVAPVIAYVPEDPHMKFKGTLSIPEPVFEQLLAHTATSLKTHGFKVIVLMGDSYGNQPAQARVAQKLTAAWAKDGVRVIHLHDYYDHNGQQMWLVNQGIGTDHIGSHAGMRDTSELLFLHPQGIRQSLLHDNRQADYDSTGANGNASRASATLGWQLIDLKINAAVRQLHREGIN